MDRYSHVTMEKGARALDSLPLPLQKEIFIESAAIVTDREPSIVSEEGEKSRPENRLFFGKSRWSSVSLCAIDEPPHAQQVPDDGIAPNPDKFNENRLAEGSHSPKKVVRPEGFEPSTHGLSIRRTRPDLILRL